MCSVSRAFRSSCSGWGRPRSAKTFPPVSAPGLRPRGPVLFATLTGFLVLVVMFVLPFSVEPVCLSKTAVDEVKVLLGRGDPLLRFLLEGVKDVARLLKADRIDSAPRVALMVSDNFQHRAS